MKEFPPMEILDRIFFIFKIFIFLNYVLDSWDLFLIASLERGAETRRRTIARIAACLNGDRINDKLLMSVSA